MGMDSQRTIDEVLQRADITEVSRRLCLSQAGLKSGDCVLSF